MDMPQANPGQMEPMAEEAPAAFTVCIQVNGDGTFAVGKEGAEQEAMEEGGPEAPEAMKPAKDAKTALTMALALMKGEIPADESEQARGFQEAFAGDKQGAM